MGIKKKQNLLARASPSFACSAGMQNCIHYDIRLLKLIYTLTITVLYVTLTMTLLSNVN